jgi:hypothetical protein
MCCMHAGPYVPAELHKLMNINGFDLRSTGLPTFLSRRIYSRWQSTLRAADERLPSLRVYCS